MSKYTIMLIFSLCFFSATFSYSQHYDSENYSEDYVNKHPELSKEIKNAILNQKVIIGMYPEEAHAAGGGFTYVIENSPGNDEPHIFTPQA